MLGAGVFTVFGPAAASAGALLPVALVLAALVASANAFSTAQLASAYPRSGGAYAYGNRYLGPWPGFAAGWLFVVGKLASCAAIALTLGAYTWPGRERVVAALAVVAVAGVNAAGVSRTARVARLSVLAVVGILMIAVVIGVMDPPLPAGPFDPGAPGIADAPGVSAGVGWAGVTQAAGLLFFAFAGYARIATLGEEVRQPRRTIPRAIAVTLGGVLILYAVIAVVLVARLGLPRLAASTAPLHDLVEQVGWAQGLVVVGAAIACLGSLLALLAGISRTTMAMARAGDLPRSLAVISNRKTPARAEFLAAVVVLVLVMATDLRSVIAFSSVGVLTYYLIANLSALAQPATERRFSRAVPIGGAVGCLVLALSLGWRPVLIAGLVLAVGLVGRWLAMATVARSRRAACASKPRQ